MGRPQDAIDELKSQWDSNLTDPNPHRRAEERPWIFSDQPHGNATKPRIGPIKQISGPYEPLGLGTSHLETARIRAKVSVNIQDDYDVTGDAELETSEDTLDYILTEMVKTVLNNQDTIQSNADALWVVPLQRGEQLPDGKELSQTVDFGAAFTRG